MTSAREKPGQISTSRKKIFGGRPAEKNKYPWMTALLWQDVEDIEDAQFCGGSLIAPDWVLTAAHCVVDEDTGKLVKRKIDVFLGSVKLTDPAAERIAVKKIIKHENYDPQTTDFDVALLHLAKPSKQKTISLIPSGDPDNLVTPGTMATIIGWGATETADISGVLLQAEVPIISDEEAQEAYSEFDYTENMFCAGYLGKGKKDTCQGDSGGPILVTDNDLKLVQAGVTSWGIECANPEYPGVYSRLAILGDWVRDKIGS
jgi:secreted trypsin-like serine protease